MADKTKPTMPANAQFEVPEYIEPPPDAVPDIGATSESNLIDAWNGTGPYAADRKPRHNYRVIAVIRTSTYILAAASKSSGITNLRQIKERRPDLPVVLSTAYGSFKDDFSSWLADAYVVKSSNLQELKSEVAKVLNRRYGTQKPH